jgi:putative transposase
MLNDCRFIARRTFTQNGQAGADNLSRRNW